MSFVTKDGLESAGFEVVSCADGAQGWETFQSADFDVCVLDVMLPEMDGFTLAKKIREVNLQVPVIFLTAKSLKEDKLEGLMLGGDDYITKPFNMEELVLRIEVFLKRSQVNIPDDEPREFRIGQYRFNFEELMLRDGDSEKRLTQREAQVLREFCLNENKVLKREDILLSVWGDDDYFLGRSLDVFIFRLRKYLKGDPAISINNIHGVGFKMVVK